MTEEEEEKKEIEEQSDDDVERMKESWEKNAPDEAKGLFDAKKV